MEEQQKKSELKEILKNRYRLVILNDQNFEEKFAFSSTLGRFLIGLAALTIFMTVLVISIVSFTPLREYIPGYGDLNSKRELIRLATKTDSIQMVLAGKEWYTNNLNMILNDQLAKPPIEKRDSSKDYSTLNLKPSSQDSLLRTEFESQDKFSIDVSERSVVPGGINSFLFFTPVKGIVTSSYNLKEGHYGVDIAAKENEFIKSTLEGTVVFTGWTNEDGYVIQIQHGNNLVSIYKHNSAVIKRIGDFVKPGDPVAIVGNSGENSNGMHLHFELWYNGSPINPQDYIAF